MDLQYDDRLAEGARGDQVEQLQQLLQQLGYDPGPVDGIFGPHTEAAVRRFQEQCGVAADGVVTDELLQWMRQAVDQWYGGGDQPETGWPDDNGGPAEGSPDGRPTGQQLADIAASQDGAEYESAGSGGDGDGDGIVEFDCSGLAAWACGQLGVEFPAGSRNQANFIPADRWISVDVAARIPGAWLFIDRGVTSGNHVGISLGNGMAIAASTDQGADYAGEDITNEVKISTIGSSWTGAALIPGIYYPGYDN
jgi:peptidoglycan hydrolase-like protein with peptidoglycan-binding domain